MTIVARLPEVTANTAEYAARLADLVTKTKALDGDQLRELQNNDAVMTGRMVQFMILHYASLGSAHLEEWPFWDEVKAGYDFVRQPHLWPTAEARSAIEMWERRQPPEVFIPAWKKMVNDVHRFADVAARLIVLEFGG